MPGQLGSGTAPGALRISMSTSPLDLTGVVLAAGAFTSKSLRIIALPGLSLLIDRTGVGAAAITATVQIRVAQVWCTLAIVGPIAAGGVSFTSWDHIAAREARVLIAGVGADVVGCVLLMAAAS